MKYQIAAFALLLAGCGSNGGAPAPTPTPAAIVATPTPTPDTTVNHPDALVGNWIDANKNMLVFNKDGTAKSKDQTLNWAVDQNDRLTFSSSSNVLVDICQYIILTSGGLTSALIVTLDMGCEKAGDLIYTRMP